YSPCRVAMPYQLLAVALNAVVLLLAVIALWAARRYYLNLLWTMFPRVEDGPLWPTVAVGAVLFLCVSAINVTAIRRRIQLIWKNKD
ncbi:MAG: ABC transporter permease, partial [Bacteroidaceae bacterium]|nr:ABC transporter permease [Bacteroidaceae bacterium]